MFVLKLSGIQILFQRLSVIYNLDNILRMQKRSLIMEEKTSNLSRIIETYLRIKYP